MKKRLTVILAVVLAISLIGSFSAYAALENMPSDAEILENAVRSGASMHKKISIGEQKGIKLTYAQTDFDTPKGYQDCYVDDNNTEYIFNEKGDFVGVFPPIETDAEKIQERESNGSIDQATALKIADQAFQDIIGSKLGNIDGELFIENQTEYYFSYNKKYGSSGWIIGENVSIGVNKD